MAYKVQCDYISDLRSLCMEPKIRKKLVTIVEKIPAESATLFEWNDALEYLTDRPSVEDREEAKKILIDCLRT